MADGIVSKLRHITLPSLDPNQSCARNGRRRRRCRRHLWSAARDRSWRVRAWPQAVMRRARTRTSNSAFIALLRFAR